jgi:type II secretory pathway component PulM
MNADLIVGVFLLLVLIYIIIVKPWRAQYQEIIDG